MALDSLGKDFFTPAGIAETVGPTAFLLLTQWREPFECGLQELADLLVVLLRQPGRQEARVLGRIAVPGGKGLGTAAADLDRTVPEASLEMGQRILLREPVAKFEAERAHAGRSMAKCAVDELGAGWVIFPEVGDQGVEVFEVFGGNRG